MKSIIIVLFLLFWAFLFSSSAAFAQIVSMPAPTKIIETNKPVSMPIDQLNMKVEKLRDENYQKAIIAVEEAGKSADRLLNWVVGIATIFGVILALVALVVGGSLISSLRELRSHVNRAKKNALLVAALSKQAQEKGEELISEIEKLKKVQEDSKGKINEKAKEIDALISKAQGTIADIGALRTSSNYISNATYASNIGSADIGNLATIGGLERCDKCGKNLSTFEGLISDFSIDSPIGKKLCGSCRLKEVGS